jgi:predicted RNase H-like HicB family nuclease
MRLPHPEQFSVDIEQRADGTWRVQVRDEPAFWGEGGDLANALDALRKRALAAVPKEVGRETILRGAAAAFAAETAVEKYLGAFEDTESGEDAGDDSSWDDVSVLAGARGPKPS